MMTLLLTVGFVWLLVAITKRCQPKPKTTILTHRLSDRDSLVVVQEDGHVAYVGLYSDAPMTTEEKSEPDWYRSFLRN